jgi:hypothetical protein
MDKRTQKELSFLRKIVDGKKSVIQNFYSASSASSVQSNKLMGKPISVSNLRDGQTLAYNSLKKQWEAKTMISNFNGSGGLTKAQALGVSLL